MRPEEIEDLCSGFGISPPGPGARRVNEFTVSNGMGLGGKYLRLQARIQLSPASEVTLMGEAPVTLPEFGQELSKFASALIKLA